MNLPGHLLQRSFRRRRHATPTHVARQCRRRAAAARLAMHRRDVSLVGFEPCVKGGTNLKHDFKRGRRVAREFPFEDLVEEKRVVVGFFGEIPDHELFAVLTLEKIGHFADEAFGAWEAAGRFFRGVIHRYTEKKRCRGKTVAWEVWLGQCGSKNVAWVVWARCRVGKKKRNR